MQRPGFLRRKRTVGYAVVGLGHIAQSEVLPAFGHAKHTRLVALVSSDAEKLEELGRRYRVKHRFSYEEFERCLELPEVDAVYIAVPNNRHLEFTERAALKGKHVLCEKPMEVDEPRCARMIRACEAAGVKLMIAYRLHFEPANLHAIDLIQRGEIGEPKFITSEFSFQVREGDIRTRADTGGGVLFDIGTYCINASRYLFRDEPSEVFAFATRSADPRFAEIDETVSCLMRFPNDRVASFTVSFGSAATSSFRVVGTKGDLRLDTAFDYSGERAMKITVNDKSHTKRFDQVDQFAPELEYFAECILDDRQPEPDGYEGQEDVRIIGAIHESLDTGRPVSIPRLRDRKRPGPEQVIVKPPHAEAHLVNVDTPYS